MCTYIFHIIHNYADSHIISYRFYTLNHEIKLDVQLKGFLRVILTLLVFYLEHSLGSPSRLWLLCELNGPSERKKVHGTDVPRTNPNLIAAKVGSVSVRSWNSLRIEKEMKLEWFRSIFDQSVRLYPEHILKSVRECFVSVALGTCCVEWEMVFLPLSLLP